MDCSKFETTYKYDYKVYDIKSTKIMNSHENIQDNVNINGETLEPWEKYIPFDLFHYSKLITQSNPYKPVFINKPANEERNRSEAFRIKTRKIPAVCLDDIKDDRIYNTIINYIYSNNKYVNLKESHDQIKIADVPKNLSKIEDGLSIPKQWMNVGKKWDDQQTRVNTDPTKIFWVKRIKNKMAK